MKHKVLWIVIGLAAALTVITLVLVGVAICFRQEISDWLLRPGLKEGARLLYQISPVGAGGTLPSEKDIRRVVLKRIDPNGSRGCIVRVPESGHLEVLVPARGETDEVQRVKRLLRRTGIFEFRIVVDRVKDREKADFERLVRLRQAGQRPDVPQYRWSILKKGYEWHKEGLLDAWNFVYVVDKENQSVEVLVDVGDGQNVTGADLSEVHASSQEGDPLVVFSLKPQAAARFARLTNPEMRNRHLAIILDGVVQSAPVLRATLSTGGVIEGYRNNTRERDEVVAILQAGELGVSLGDPILEESFGPDGATPVSERPKSGPPKPPG